MEATGYRGLICITTCQRLAYLRRYLPHFARAVVDDPRYSLLVSLDGTEDETVEFCREWEIPLIYSARREGVGLSKNRVLERFPDFDHYFFLDDDVELLDPSVFSAHVEVATSSGFHHFSLFESGGLRKPTASSSVDGHTVLHGMYGGGCFNFFTGEGLRRVGGWHPLFARYRRGGHTEHSYRFYRAGLAPAPFNVIADRTTSCIWHSPPMVTRVQELTFDEDQLSEPERALIDEGRHHYPVQTLSPYTVTTSTLDAPRRLAATLDGGERYPLVSARERRQCRSSHHLGRSRRASTPSGRAGELMAAAWNWPGNPELKHTLKTLVKR